MFSAVVAARETSTRTGLWRKASARRVISGGMVAEKNSVWRVNGTKLADALDVGNEAHVEHSVRFVDDQDLDRVQEQAAASGEIEQASGCCDDHVVGDARFLGFLIAERDAANQQCEVQLVVDFVFGEGLFDLRGELARRLKNEGARHPGARAAAFQQSTTSAT